MQGSALLFTYSKIYTNKQKRNMILYHKVQAEKKARFRLHTFTTPQKYKNQIIPKCMIEWRITMRSVRYDITHYTPLNERLFTNSITSRIMMFAVVETYVYYVMYCVIRPTVAVLKYFSISSIYASWKSCCSFATFATHMPLLLPIYTPYPKP